MNDEAILERRYRWLLRWYPPSFRNENEDEVLGVLMAGVRDGKRWPSVAEAANVLRSALRMRFRLPPAGSENPGWSDAWAAFSVLAPVFLLVTSLAVAEVPPYFLQMRSRAAWFNANVLPRYDWLPFPWDARAFYILLIFQAVIVTAVLAGWRWVALAMTLGSAVYWGATQVTYPEPVTPLTAAAYILENGGTARLARAASRPDPADLETRRVAVPGGRRGQAVLAHLVGDDYARIPAHRGPEAAGGHPADSRGGARGRRGDRPGRPAAGRPHERADGCTAVSVRDRVRIPGLREPAATLTSCGLTSPRSTW